MIEVDAEVTIKVKEWCEWKEKTEIKEWGEIYCPFLGYKVMTYYPENSLGIFYTYTLPFIDEDGDILYFVYDHEEETWDLEVYYYV